MAQQRQQQHKACEFSEDGMFGCFDPYAPCLEWECEASWWAQDQSSMFQAQGFHDGPPRVVWCHGMEDGTGAWMPATMEQEAWGVPQDAWGECGEVGMPISV